MKKLIFNQLYFNTIKFFFATLLVISLIVLTLQAVNYFDIVIEEGHGISIYFLYTLLSFPKIISRILPFIFFISLFYILIVYETKNELNIFWVNGVSKIEFLNKLITLSVFLMIIQIFLGSFFSPFSQLKARDLLRSSNIDLLSTLIKKGKFVNLAQNITIFVEEKNNDNSFKNIFLEDARGKNLKMIFAKNGKILNDETSRKLELNTGRVIDNKNSNITVFNFDKIYFNLKELSVKTIMVPKIQEINTFTLLNCLTNKREVIYRNFNCEDKIMPEIKRELFKRLLKPFYIPIVTIITTLLIVNSNQKIRIKQISLKIFTLGTLMLLISEASTRYVATSNLMTNICLLAPVIFFIFFYVLIYKKFKNV